MANPNEICNLALSHLGNGKPVNNYLTDVSAEALACKAFFRMAVNTTLKAFHWDFARRVTSMGAIALPTGIESSWTYAYRYPTDCLEIRSFTYPGFANNAWTAEGPGLRGGYDPRTRGLDLNSFSLMDDDAGTIVLSNQSIGQIEYTSTLENYTTHMPDDFVLVVSYKLASFIAPRVTAGDQYQLGPKALAMYQQALGEARTNAIRQSPRIVSGRAPWMIERDV